MDIAMIKIRSLRIDYEGVTAVRDLDLEVLPGQIYGLVGPNGAGKTSTLKAIAGIIEPTYGEISIGGHDMELQPRKALAHLGFMPDFPPVYEHLKVWEYLEVFAAAYLIPQEQRRERCRAWIDEVKLGEKWDVFVSTLSRGMRQRLVLAKTLLHDPSVVLLDEPASGLDPIARLEMRGILTRIAAKGKTIVISSHILSELSDFCNAIGIMEKGRMVVSGSIDDIRRSMGIKNELVIVFAELSLPQQSILSEYLGRHTLVSNAALQPGAEMHCYFSGGAHDAAALNRDLVHLGLPVSQITLKKATMEDIFFQIGARETS